VLGLKACATTTRHFFFFSFFATATGHITLAGICNYHPLLPIKYFVHPQQAPQQVLALSLEK
jgi:hypothetical protein